MPAKSQAQRGMIFAKRDKYGSKAKTPKKWKWIWDEDWENKGKLPKKAKNETVQNVVFKESFRAKMVNETGDYPWGADEDPGAPWHQDSEDHRIKSVEINKDGEVELSWKTMTAEDDFDEETETIDRDTMNDYLSKHLNIDLEPYDEEGTDIITNLEEVEDEVYQVYGPDGKFVTTSFEDLADLTS
jgi:hypothetical protein